MIFTLWSPLDGFGWVARTISLGLLGVVLLLSGCDRQKVGDAGSTSDGGGEAPPPSPPQGKLFDLTPSGADRRQASAPPSGHGSRFVDVASDLGLDFVYENGAQGRSLMVETMGGGVGCLDFDGDGRWDLFFCQGGDPALGADASQPPVALYRLENSGRFVDVAEQAGLGSYGYGQGVAIGDFNHDGFDDIYITNVGKNTLLLNMGDGTFRDVTDESGVGDERWSSSAAFADLTGDGNLDLYVCNYVVYDPADPLDCRNAQGEYRICHPREMQPWPDECYINLGDGRFRAEASARGLTGEGSKGLGVAVADFNDNGLLDIYVANDTTANFLFINQGGGRFREQALLLGCAVNHMGAFEASMGLAVGDYDHNGLLDIYSTHFYEESNTLYRNLGPAGFQDVTSFVGLHGPTLRTLGFGAVMGDFNQDGRQELFVTNGHIENYPGNPLHEMRPQMFAFDGSRWHESGERAGDFFQGKYVGRGVATIDFDDDGALDLVVVHQNAPAALLRNESERGSWLKLMFRGRQSNRRGIGCHVAVEAGEARYVQQLVGGGSYVSSHQPALIFGLGEHRGPCQVEVRWPNGNVQRLDAVEPGQTLYLDEADAAPGS